MYKNIFQKAGFTPTQVAILEYLYKKKEDKASVIARNIKKSRAMVYKDLDELAEMKIIEKIDEPDKVSIFRATHPRAMETFFDNKEQKIKKDREQFLSYLPDMVSSYNLINNKPGIKYYEGTKGIETIIKDSLTTKGEIYSYLDTKTATEKIPSLIELYTEERLKKNIIKKIIEPDNDFIREYLSKHGEKIFGNTTLTQSKLIDNPIFDLHTIVQIYDNKVSYNNFSGKNIISVIIEDSNIAYFHKKIFEFNWNQAKTLEDVLR